MDPFTIAMIASAVLGQAKGEEGKRNYKKEQGIESLKTRFAPFTGDRGQTLRSPSSIDPMMQALVTGAMIGKQLKGSGLPGYDKVGGALEDANNTGLDAYGNGPQSNMGNGMQQMYPWAYGK